MYELEDYNPVNSRRVQKIDARSMFWAADDSRGLYLGTHSDDISTKYPDFKFEKIFLSKDKNKEAIYIFKCESIDKDYDLEITTSFDKAVPLMYLKKGGSLVVKDETDLYLINALKYIARAGKCTLCGSMTYERYINYCCEECYSILKNEVRLRGFANLPSVSKKTLDIASIFGGEHPTTCPMCGEASVAYESDICNSCGKLLKGNIKFINAKDN